MSSIPSCVAIFSFFFNDTATTEIYTYGHTLSLHDALPISIEYSANLEQRLDIAALCATALEAAASTGVLELGATRVRAVRCDHYAIADRHRDNAFVDVSLRIGRGRSEEAKDRKSVV